MAVFGQLLGSICVSRCLRVGHPVSSPSSVLCDRHDFHVSFSNPLTYKILPCIEMLDLAPRFGVRHQFRSPVALPMLEIGSATLEERDLVTSNPVKGIPAPSTGVYSEGKRSRIKLRMVQKPCHGRGEMMIISRLDHVKPEPRRQPVDNMFASIIMDS
jgi:hypothetical protein